MQALCLFVLTFTLLSGSVVFASDEPIKWSWRCAISGVYQVEVLPNGTVRPTTEIADKTPIEIVVKEADRTTLEACGTRNSSYQYYIQLSGNNLANFYKNGLCSQRVELHYDTLHVRPGRFPDLEGVESAEIYGTVRSLLVHRDDAEWRFILSSTSLLTARESRRLKATVPIPGLKFDPEASSSLLTGECVMTAGE